MSNSQKQPSRKGAEFLCKVRYKNPLPDVPFGPRLLANPFDESQIYAYSDSDWSKRAELPVITDPDLGMAVDLVDMRLYDDDQTGGNVETEDQVLLKSLEELAGEVAGDGEGETSKRYRPLVPWLRRTEYISNDAKLSRRKQENMEMRRLQKQLEETPDLFDQTRDGQIAAIKRSFEAASKYDDGDLQSLRHPTKKGVHAVECLPLYPDFKHWAATYSHCLFDDVVRGRATNEKDESLLKVYQSADGNAEKQFIVHYVPERAVTAAEDMLMPFRRVRQYTFHMTRPQAMSKLLFVRRPGKGVYFNSVGARFSLRKKRKPKSGATNSRDQEHAIPTTINLTERRQTGDERANTQEIVDRSLGMRV